MRFVVGAFLAAHIATGTVAIAAHHSAMHAARNAEAAHAGKPAATATASAPCTTAAGSVTSRGIWLGSAAGTISLLDGGNRAVRRAFAY